MAVRMEVNSTGMNGASRKPPKQQANARRLDLNAPLVAVAFIPKSTP
jgi:hypothetical protein